MLMYGSNFYKTNGMKYLLHLVYLDVFEYLLYELP